jgi:hypothetical protein
VRVHRFAGSIPKRSSCCATPSLLLQLSLFSEVPGFPPAHLPAAPGYGGGDGFRGNHFGGGFGGYRGRDVRGHWGLLWAYDSPDLNWDGQNNFAAVSACRSIRQSLGDVVVVGERHLRHLLRSYLTVCVVRARFHREGALCLESRLAFGKVEPVTMLKRPDPCSFAFSF